LLSLFLADVFDRRLFYLLFILPPCDVKFDYLNKDNRADDAAEDFSLLLLCSFTKNLTLTFQFSLAAVFLKTVSSRAQIRLASWCATQQLRRKLQIRQSSGLPDAK
jgi:hypothetical protein